MRAAGILFDKDGTLFDFEATYAPATAGVVRALAASEDQAHALASAVGFDIAAGRFSPTSIVIAGTAADMARIWGPLIGEPGDAALAAKIDLLYEHHARRSMALFERASEVLEKLVSAGFKVGLATNDAEANGRSHLQAADIERHFSFVAGYDFGPRRQAAAGHGAGFRARMRGGSAIDRHGWRQRSRSACSAGRRGGGGRHLDGHRHG